MKKFQVLFLGIVTCCVSFAQISASEETELDILIQDQVRTEADELKSASINQLFEATFYTVKRIRLYETNESFNDYLFCKQSGIMKQIEEPNELVACLKKDFRLKDEASAGVLQKALTLLFNDVSARNQDVVHKEGVWYIIQGDWFGTKNGYVVKTDENGIVSEIERNEEIEL